ncbi:MAG: S-methyl-5'-thioadenosine phosphorylase [Ardenticatenaceae bacterium]|nr:S-methyl-5'-thioadenosine phosphorylase [Ardenticatenaceae bacterium]
MTTIDLAIIGGSGLYDMAALEQVEEIEVQTPFGDPSDRIILGTLHGRKIAFLPRHGRGHFLSPADVPYRANIYALKSLGVKYIVAVNACGSLKEEIAPGHIVVPDQLYDRTTDRPRSFFGKGLVAHISVADPFDASLRQVISGAVRQAGGIVHEGGNFIIIEGPRFSTRGESNIFRQLGLSIIGMTSCPEAFLAMEAEIAYASMAHVTDYDVWHESEDPVTVEMVIQTLQKNTQIAQDAIAHIVLTMDEWAGDSPAHSALRDALITNPQRIDGDARKRLALLVDKYLS